MLRVKKVLVAVGITISTVVSAQSGFVKGYMITTAGDTMRGEIRYNPKNDLGLFDAVSFQTNANDKKSYRSNKIKEFAFDGIVFVARTIDDKQVFVKRLSAGAVNLYEYKTEQFFMNNIHTYTDYYMEKVGTTEMVHIKESKYKKQLSDVMSDDQNLLKEIHDNKYEFEKIVDVFEQYNKDKEGNKG